MITERNKIDNERLDVLDKNKGKSLLTFLLSILSTIDLTPSQCELLLDRLGLPEAISDVLIADNFSDTFEFDDQLRQNVSTICKVMETEIETDRELDLGLQGSLRRMIACDILAGCQVYRLAECALGHGPDDVTPQKLSGIKTTMENLQKKYADIGIKVELQL